MAFWRKDLPFSSMALRSLAVDVNVCPWWRKKMQEHWCTLLSPSSVLPLMEPCDAVFVPHESCLLSYSWLERDTYLPKLSVQNLPPGNLGLWRVCAGLLKDLHIEGLGGWLSSSVFTKKLKKWSPQKGEWRRSAQRNTGEKKKKPHGPIKREIEVECESSCPRSWWLSGFPVWVLLSSETRSHFLFCSSWWWLTAVTDSKVYDGRNTIEVDFFLT